MGNGRICCVPFCPSRSGTPGVSLHEIPSNPEIRQKWLTIISRRDSSNANKAWTPGSRSAACSRHFLDSDYNNNHKQKRLKQDAVPSVFPEYPAHKLPLQRPPRKKPAQRTSIIPLKRKRTNSSDQIVPSFPSQEDFYTSNTLDKADHIEESMKKKCLTMQRRIKQFKTKINNLACAVRRKDKIISSLRKEQRKEKLKPCPLVTSVNRMKEDADKGNVKALILLQQLEAYGKSRFRWSELCLRMCVLWRSKSPRAYKFARRHFVSLPSRSTLGNYVGPSSLETGLTSLAKIRLTEEFKNLTDIGKLCSLIFDEMSLKPSLQYRKQADKIIGKAEFGKSAKSGNLANKLLCFVLKGLAKNYRIPVAYYLVGQLQGCDLSKLILEVISQIETIGFRVCRLVCDDATTNVKALSIICDGSLQHEIQHPIRETDPLFISFDPCHIIKNVRNQFLDDSRNLTNNNKPITGKPIKTLYENQRLLPVKPVRFLTRKSVYPTSFEKMNVKRAIQIFSTEVIAALEFCKEKNLPGFRNLDETLDFMKKIHKWFVIHNVCNTTHHITSRDESRKHFGMVDDARLDWLGGEFLGYLESWKKFSTSLPSKGKGNSKTQHFLTNETYTAIRITTSSTIACIRYLIGEGFHFVLTRKFSSDDVEGIFSAVRASQGYNDQANAVGSLYALETILKTGLFSCSSFGNTAQESTDSLTASFPKRNVIRSSLPTGSLIELNSGQKLLASQIRSPARIQNVTIKTAGISMVAGFLLRLLKDKHECPHAGISLVGTSNDSVNKLISLQDRGGLLYPSETFVGLVKLILDILDSCDHSSHIDAVVKSWKMTLIQLLPDGLLVCGCGNQSHNSRIRDLVLGSLCRIYFNNVCFNSTNIANEKPKFTHKPSSKKIKKL